MVYPKWSIDQVMNDLPRYARFSLIGLGIALCITAMIVARGLFLPLFWAVLFTLLILPLHHRLEKALGRKGLAAILSVFILIVLILGVVFLLSAQVMALINDLPSLFGKLSPLLEKLRLLVEENLGIPYHEQPSALLNRLSNFIQESFSSFGEALSNTLKTLVYIAILPVYIFFMLYYRHRLVVFIEMLNPPRERRSALRTTYKATKVVQKYLSGMVIVTGIVALLTLVLFLGLGVKHALFFAVFVAVFNLIPYVGVIIASVVSILYVFITKDSLIYPLLTFLLLWGIQLLENNLITPFVVGHQIQLNPLVVILAIILGGLIWGISGMILFIPLLGGLKVVMDEIPALRPYGYLLGDDPPDKNARN